MGVSNLMLWLDASQITGLSDGDPVTTWTDMSGNSRNATQGTASLKPTYRTSVVNGQPGVRFDGTDDAMTIASLPIPSDATIFIVAKNSQQAGTGSIYKPILAATNNPYQGVGTGYGMGYRRDGMDAYHFALGNGATQDTLVHSRADNDLFEINTMRKSGTSATVLRNGALVSSGTMLRTTGFHSGSYAIGGDISFLDRRYLGDIVEIIVYGHALTVGERTTVESYLSSKYGIP